MVARYVEHDHSKLLAGNEKEKKRAKRLLIFTKIEKIYVVDETVISCRISTRTTFIDFKN